jgi:hypothetical protein
MVSSSPFTNPAVIAELDPAIHLLCEEMDPRVTLGTS